MLVAPHPDDESLACGVILQRALRAHAAVRVIYATDGENNPWPQRLQQRKWRLNRRDRARWGRVRRKEALDALSVLGMRRSETRFLGLPDQGLTDLLVRDCQSTVALFAKLITDYAPTHLIFPGLNDTHPDHNALAVLIRLVMKHFVPSSRQIAMWNFVVHGSAAGFSDEAVQLQPSPRETTIKIAAISSHITQLRLSQRRFLGYGFRPERFFPFRLEEKPPMAESPIRLLRRQPKSLELQLAPSRALFSRRRPRLLLLGHRFRDEVTCAMLPLPFRSAAAEMFDYTTGRCLRVTQIRGTRMTRMSITIPTDFFSPNHALFLKLDRPAVFFGEAGWFEMPPLTSAPSILSRIESEQIGLDSLQNVA